MKLRFTIRDFVWVLIVAAVGIAWWADHTRLKVRTQWLEDKLNSLLGDANENKELRERIRKLDPTAGFQPTPEDGK